MTNITRDEINQALWSDHDARIQSPKAKQIIQELLTGTGTALDPDDFELRLMRYDEYARAASSQGYGQKELWTWFDGYYALGEGAHSGLFGGDRDGGGAASVDNSPRGVRDEDIALRVVLSRRT